MKFIYRITLSICCLFTAPTHGYAQSKHHKTEPAPKFRDSTSYEIKSDTVKGTIKVNIDNGHVVGEGAIITVEYWITNWHLLINKEERPLNILDVTLMAGSYGDGHVQGKSTHAYIKSQGEWKRVDEEYTFIPYQ